MLERESDNFSPTVRMDTMIVRGNTVLISYTHLCGQRDVAAESEVSEMSSARPTKSVEAAHCESATKETEPPPALSR